MRMPRSYTLVAVTCIVLAGCDQCSKKEEAAKPAAETTAPADATTAATAVAPTPTPAPATENASGSGSDTGSDAAPANDGTLKITDVKVGSGAVAADGKKVSVNYTGTLVNGTQFDSTKDRGTPFSFVLGSGMVIAGWDQGVKGMKEGGVRKLVIPPALAYGNRSVGGVIPPNSVLLFEIELVKVE